MESNTEGNLLEIMDLARTLRQEQLFIQQEQATFAQLTEALSDNSTSITKLAYICAQQRRNLNDLIVARPELGPSLCCRRANNYEKSNFVDSKKVLNYEHAIAYEELFNYLYKSPYILAVSLATGDRIADISPHHQQSVIQTISTGLFGNAINTKDVEMTLKLLRELIEIQIVTSDNPRRLLRANASSFSRLYHRLNESMFSAKIFLTAALFQPIMSVLTETDTILDVDPQKIIKGFSSKERIRRFGPEDSVSYAENIDKFHKETITKLHSLAKTFIDSLLNNWSLFPSTLRWLVQTMCHLLKQSHHFSEKIMNEIITDMVFTHFICPAIISPDVMGIIDAPISEQVQFNLMQICHIIQMLALTRHDQIDACYAEIYGKFESNMVTRLIDLLLVTQTGEDVVAILAQQSDFDRTQLLATQRDLNYFIDFFRILTASDEYDVPTEDKDKLKKILKQLPESSVHHNGNSAEAVQSANDSPAKEKSKQSLISKATKSKLAKTMSFSTNGNSESSSSNSLMVNGHHINGNGLDNPSSSSSNHNSNHSSPTRSLAPEVVDNEPILIFNLYNCSGEQKLQPLSEDEVLKMNSIGQDNSDLVDTENYQQESTVDKSSVVNGFDGIDGMSDVLRPLHNKNPRFSLSHDDASIGNSDNLEAVSEVPSNHSVTSSLELEENAENDNLSDMVSANVSGRGTPNISGRDTPSSMVTDGESLNNALPTPQMQKLISKARSDIEDKFCKFEIKKFEGDETVSIISDTWSTDVLASDSEAVDAVERERERNFSTPLIPAAVILPGDNNFDVRAGYLDASDQRSESNWSTDVLASDSEKLNEVDTDDNASITARSDTSLISLRSERERNQLAAAISSAPSNRHHGRPSLSEQFFSGMGARGNRNSSRPSMASQNVAAAKPPSTGSVDDVNISGGSSGGNASDRSQEDSPFYDAVNSYDDNSNPIANNPSQHHYRDGSSLARSSVRTTNQHGTAEDSFQQNYKCIANDGGDDKDSFLTPSTSSAAANAHRNRMRRQTSAESSISNQSLSLEEQGAAAAAKLPSPFASTSRKKRNASNESKDLIDFSDFCDDKDLTPPSIAPPKPPLQHSDSLNEDLVERRQSNNLHDDGRRNGIMALKGGRESSERGSSSTPHLRRHQSLNYENHEIVLNTVPTRISAMPNLSPENDNKTEKKPQQSDELLQLCNKTSELQIHQDNNNDNNDDSTMDNSLEAARNTPTNNMASSGIMTQSPSTKPTKSTGAIPKSISFDASADKVHGASTSAAAAGSSTSRHQRSASSRLPDTMRTNGLNPASSNSAGIFNKLKQGIFKHRRGHKSRHASANANSDEITQCPRSVSFSNNTSEVALDLLGANLPSTSSAAAASNQDRNAVGGYYDITEDILAKYRRKVSTSSEATNSSIGNGASGGGGAVGGSTIEESSKEISSNNNNQHPSMHDKTLTFNIIKKKIRTVLSKTDLHSGDFRHTTHANISPLLTYLQIQLAQAINLQNFQQISYVSEAIRCISTLDVAQHTQLMQELQNDIQKRQSYLQYLMRYRQNLLMIMENIEQFESRLRSESSTCNRYLMALCMRLFFEKKQDSFATFQEEFAQRTVSDDKIDLIEEFLDSLVAELLAPGGILNGMPEWQAIEARLALERILLQSIYRQVMFPNEDADLSRDTVLSEHIRKLQNVITPSHSALCIPQIYLSEAPWSFAQQQLSYISAYKTPREKLQCVVRCISSIMSLLHMSSGRVPAADDILPVLIYVVIMANPPYLLSTVEYITCFIGDKLDGEEQFYWTLFGSVVKFIKTMDYFEQ